MSYKYLNMNPHNLDVEDCSVRTISSLENIPWNSAYKKLSNFARKRGLMMDSVEAVEEYLDTFYDRIPIKEKTVGQFVKNHKTGKYAITMSNHITALIDGTNYDIWNSSRKRNLGCLEY